MKKFTKTIVKEFKTGFGRFLAIMAIVALGVGFLIGIMQATPDMRNTMSDYYIENAAYDIDVKGTYGLTAEDVSAVSATEGVDTAVAVISTDVALSRADGDLIGRIVALPSVEESSLNRLTLVEGDWPSGKVKDGIAEVVAIRSTNKFAKIGVGDVLTLDAETSTYGDIYAAEQVRVVGIVTSPDYYYLDGREITTLGSGVVETVLFTPHGTVYEDLTQLQAPGNLSMIGLLNAALGEEKIAYTDCWVGLTDTAEYVRFSDRYEEFVGKTADRLEGLGEERSAAFAQALDSLRENPLLSQMLGGKTLSDAQWMLLGRADSNISYISYEMNVDKVEQIAGVFPVFFIVVAALVALTSMTRMVEEDRMQIGTFKALGYSNGRIMSKYLIYCLVATLIGCVAGVLFGFSLLPSIFWQAYSTMYQLPALSLGFSPWLALAVFGVAIAGMMLVTWLTCRSSLREKPSTLMQPKAPKAGKRILLERVGFLWKPLKFKWKATVRNIFRYKKNMLLTIISVMGCTALILTGFGLNDSVAAASDLQYSKVILYDCAVGYSGELPSEGALREFIGSDEGVGERYIAVYSESGSLVFENGGENVDLYLVEDAAQFGRFISLHERKNSAIIDITAADAEGYALPEGAEGAIVLPENIASVYDVSAGDVITFRTGLHSARLVVYGVCENYTGTGTYMSRAAYEKLFGAVEDNTLLVKSGVSEKDVDEISKTLLNDSSVTSVDFVSTDKEMFAGLESTMGLVIAVLVVCAGGLAAIVLYNLTNINIDERRREIATLRVLGYRKGEVAGYIYRESAILTIVGSLLGLALGFFLHMFIISRVSSVTMMFGRAIGGLSYLWAFLLTAAFAVIVYAFMLIKLYRIDMAESLKSNE